MRFPRSSTLTIPILSLALAPVTFGEDLAPQSAAIASQEYLLEVYSDFQCPFCAKFAEPVRQLHDKGVDGVRTKVVFKHFPLEFHPDAQLAHQATVAAAEQGKWWEMHDLLFAKQAALKRADILSHAAKLGLDIARFESDLDSDRTRQIVASDKADGAKRGVNGTPTFFLNGQEYTGAKSYEQLKDLILSDHRRSRALTELNDGLFQKGPSDAKVTIEFFADLQSPVSAPALSAINEILLRYPNAVRLQFRNFPLVFHSQSAFAHDAAMVAARHGHFWRMTEFAVARGESLREQDLIEQAGRLGMDPVKFADGIRNRIYLGRVEADLAEGGKRGVRGSPVLFVAGQRIDGVPSVDALAALVETELKK